MKKIIGACAAALLLLSCIPASAASITYPYTGHVQGVGWQGMTGDGATAGTTGKSLRLEALNFVWPGQQARGHVQGVGWQPWQAGDATQVGTTGQSRRLEAVQVKSTIPGVTIECQAHVQGLGWLPPVRDGEVCGTTGKGLRLEAVRLWLVDTDGHHGGD